MYHEASVCYSSYVLVPSMHFNMSVSISWSAWTDRGAKMDGQWQKKDRHLWSPRSWILTPCHTHLHHFTSIYSVRNCVRTLQLDQTLFTQITKMNQQGHKEIESGVCPGVCKISSDSSSVGSSSFKYILAPSSSQSWEPGLTTTQTLGPILRPPLTVSKRTNKHATDLRSNAVCEQMSVTAKSKIEAPTMSCNELACYKIYKIYKFRKNSWTAKRVVHSSLNKFSSLNKSNWFKLEFLHIFAGNFV